VYNVIVIKGTCVVQNLNGQVLLFDVGGSHVSASAFGSHTLELFASQSVPVPPNAGLSEFMGAIAFLAERVRPGRIPPGGASVAIPNPFDYSLGISYMRHKYQYLYGIDLRVELSKLLRCPPEKISFLNDAAAFLTGEIQQGAGKSVNRVVGITLGTGVGSAFAIDGKILANGSGVPPGGEIWNVSYKDGIVEDFVSAAAIQRIHQQHTGSWEDVLIIANAASANQDARLTFERFGKELGEVLRTTCSAFEPERIVLGGGISRAAALFLPAAAQELARLPTQLTISHLGERAALIGAAVNWVHSQNGPSSSLPEEQDRTRADLG
jgi:glucokinase